MIQLRRALLSVSDKSGLAAFAGGLHRLGVELLSTGGTAQAMRAAGLSVVEVADLTGVPELLDGRVKTLHPAIHAGLLAIRGNPEHTRQLAACGIQPIDLLAVNLYPFEAAAARSDLSLPEVIEQIDIGGPALLRAAAKNFEGVAVVTDPADYPMLLAELEERGEVSRLTRFRLAQKVFAHTARYDALIAGFLETGAGRLAPELAAGEGEPFPALLSLRLERVQALRYGENPHQPAALYREIPAEGGIAAARQLQGKELSYNNLLDLDAAWALAQEFQQPAVAIIKHTNPCGVATDPDQAAAFLRARATDPVSAFGGIIGLSRPLTGPTAAAIADGFVEAIVAPGYGAEALARLAGKKALRLLEMPAASARRRDIRAVSGGLLLQAPDGVDLDPAALKVVTRRAPSETELRALRFAWKVAKHVKSNAIVFTTESATVGIGAGQMSRVDSVRLAISKAVLPTQGTVLASDAFFPFRDGVDAAAGAGVTAIIQPGGSVRDDEVVAAADEHDLAMIFTGVRHFRH